jgi:hypothetical protein
MPEGLDTDTLLAILASLLDPPLPEQHVLLDALVRSNGEVELAAESLRQKHTSSSGSDASQTLKKRPATGVLDDWFNTSVAESSEPRKKGKVASKSSAREKAPREHPASPVPPMNKSPSKSLVLSKPLVPFTEVLRPPPPASPSVPRLAPLALSNPAMVEKHTPCTLHLGVLPQELACRLFHLMVDASQGRPIPKN